MSRQTKEEIEVNLAEQLDYNYIKRDDAGVASAIQNGERIDAVYCLGSAGLIADFMAYIGEKGVLAHWQSFGLDNAKQGLFLPAIQLVLLYSCRVLFGIESLNALPALLFSNLPVMLLIGFQASQVVGGLSNRGSSKRSGQRQYSLMDPQALADNLCKATPANLARLFNGTIHCLAASGVFMAEMMVVVDGTKVVTTRSYIGCGCIRVGKRKKKSKQGVSVKEWNLLYGWRLIALMDMVTLIPLSIKIVQIQQHEAPYLVELVEQAQANLGSYSRIKWLVIDRAYVDGKSLYRLHRMGIKFVVIAKTTMIARQTALAKQEQATIQQRVEVIRHGQGAKQSLETLTTRLYTVTHINDWKAYAPDPKSEQTLTNRRDPNPSLNAVVLETWQDKDPAKTGARVYLTNASVDNPWTIVDLYDDRSWIENGLFRNSKQFQGLTRWFPKRTEAGVRFHLTFVMMIQALVTAYRLHCQAQQGAPHLAPDNQIVQTSYYQIDPDTGDTSPISFPDDPLPIHLDSQLHLIVDPLDNPDIVDPEGLMAHSLLAGIGLLRWRRQLEQEHRNQVIVVIGNRYGIFDLQQLLLWLGANLAGWLPP